MKFNNSETTRSSFIFIHVKVYKKIMYLGIYSKKYGGF